MRRRYPGLRVGAWWMLASAVFGASGLLAQTPATAAAVTEPGRSLDRALDIALGGKTHVGDASGERLLFLLIDATPSLQKAGFADRLAQALQRRAKDLQHTRIGVAKVGAKRPVVLAPTSDRRRVAAAVRNLLASPSTGFKNVFAAARALATPLAAGEGTRELTLVTLDDGDVEDDLEGTVSRLQRIHARVTVITSEAYLADSYWAQRPYERAPRGSRLVGGDGPFIDLPWGWLFQITVANEVTPSGHATYGLSRLAAATGGRVFLYTPPNSKGHDCAVYGYCNFCAGDHIAPAEIYWSGRVRPLAPATLSRRDAFRAVAGDPYFKAVVRAWQRAAKAGLIRSLPALRVTGTGVKPARQRFGRDLGLTRTLQFARAAARADKAALECGRILQALASDIKRASSSQGRPRQRAMAEMTRVLLQLTKVNLVTFSGWCREIAPSLVDRRAADPEPPERRRQATERRPVAIWFTDLVLCHGVRPFFGIELPGGKRLRTELAALDSLTTSFMERYAHTPFAVALHRAGIARFHLLYPGIAPIPRRIRPKSKTAMEHKPITPRGRRPRRGAASGAGTTGPITGGKR